MVKKNTFYIVFILLILSAGILTGCRSGLEPAVTAPSQEASQTSRKVVRVFCAGSLIVPGEELEKAFEAANPDVDVQSEYHGSIQVIRHVTELHEPIDVVMTADHALIPMLMYETINEETGLPYAEWYIRFAGNSLALAYTPESRYADEINQENWYQILARPDVKIGLADPRFDAAGYRAMMVTTLAEKVYRIKGLHDALFKNSFTYPITRFTEEGLTEITIPEILEPVSGSNIVMRGSSIQLLALLESGDVDYAFEYQSVIAQHNLQSISLPESINLGSEDETQQYQAVEVTLDFQRFASVKPVFRGEPIGYGITIPTNAPQPEAAERYVAFLLSPQGRAVMESVHHPLLDSYICDQQDKVPALLRQFCPVIE